MPTVERYDGQSFPNRGDPFSVRIQDNLIPDAVHQQHGALERGHGPGHIVSVPE